MISTRNVTKTLIALAVLTLVLAGCTQLGISPGNGTIALNFSQRLNVQTIQPDAPFTMDVDNYVVTGTGSNGGSFTETIYAPTQSLIETSLIPGEWTIDVAAFNDIGVQIGEGSETDTVTAGNVLSMTITIVPLSGTGTLDLMVSWPVNIITNPVIQASLTPVGETYNPTNHDISLLSETPDVSGTAQVGYENASQATGYYTLSLTLFDDYSVPVWGTVESVRIVFGQTSAKDFVLVEDTNRGGLDLSVVEDLENPVSITFDVANDSEFSLGNDVVVTATADAPVTTFSWYLQGAPQSAGIVSTGTDSTITLTGLGLGYYWLDVVTVSGDNDDVLSSETVEFQVKEVVIATATVNLPAFGTTYGVPGVTHSFQDPLPAGATIQSIQVDTQTSVNFTTPGVYAAVQAVLNGHVSGVWLVPYQVFGTEGAPGMPYWVPKTYTHTGDHPDYVYGGTNAVTFTADWNYANIDVVTLTITYEY